MKKCLVWLIEVIKNTCIFFLQNFGLKILKPSETSKYHSGGPKTLISSKNYPYLISPFAETAEKYAFLPQNGLCLPN